MRIEDICCDFYISSFIRRHILFPSPPSDFVASDFVGSRREQTPDRRLGSPGEHFVGSPGEQTPETKNINEDDLPQLLKNK